MQVTNGSKLFQWWRFQRNEAYPSNKQDIWSIWIAIKNGYWEWDSLQFQYLQIIVNPLLLVTSVAQRITSGQTVSLAERAVNSKSGCVVQNQVLVIWQTPNFLRAYRNTLHARVFPFYNRKVTGQTLFWSLIAKYTWPAEAWLEAQL